MSKKNAAIKDILAHPSVLSALCIAFGLLYIPAFMYGVMSIWLVIMSCLLGLRFRAGIEKLNTQIDAKDPNNIWPYHGRVVLLNIECFLCSFIPFFLILYIDSKVGNLRYPCEGRSVDQVINFFPFLSNSFLFDFSSICHHNKGPIIATGHVFVYFTLFSLFLLAGKSYWNYSKRTMFPIIKKKRPDAVSYESMSTHYSSIYNLPFGACALLLFLSGDNFLLNLSKIMMGAEALSFIQTVKPLLAFEFLTFVFFFVFMSFVTRIFEIGTNIRRCKYENL